MSSAIPDTELRAYSEHARDKVVIITGGAMGLGKQAGEEFIRAGCVFCQLVSLYLAKLNRFLHLTYPVLARR